MLDRGVDPNIRLSCGSPLCYAAHRNDREMIDLLLEYGADVTALGNESLLHLAVCNGDHALINSVIVAGGDVTDVALVTVAIHRNHPETLEYLLERGATITEFDPRSTEWSRINGRTIRALIKLGVEVPPDIANHAQAYNW